MMSPIASDTAELETIEIAPETIKAKGTFVSVTLLILGIAVHLLFLLSLRFGWLNPLFNDTMHRFGPAGDFFSLYAAGVKARAGESVYTVGGHVETVPYAYAFRYAPLVAYTLGAALSLLPAITAYAVWLITCELALLRNLRLTLALAPDKRTGYIAAALWLLFTPYYLELFVGQFTFITASLVFWAYLGWAQKGKAENRKAVRTADGLWAAAVCLKMMPLLYLPVTLLRGHWKSALAVGLVLTGTSAVYFAHFPRDWAVFVGTNIQEAPAGHSGNLGLMAFLYHAVGERAEPFALLRTAVLCVLGVCLAWLTYRAWAAGRQGERREERLLTLYAACSAVYLLGYKDVWEHHYVLLLPPLVLLALGRASAWLWLPPFLLSALPGLFVLYDLPGLGYNEDPQVYWHRDISLLHHGLKPLGPLWLLTGLLWRSVPPCPQFWGSQKDQVRLFLILLPQNWGAGGGLRPWGQGAALLGGALLVLAGVPWTRAAIRDQRQVARTLVWPASVFQLQRRHSTCGPAALAAVCRHFGVPATEDEIAKLAGTTDAGTTMLGLRDAAERKGMAAEGVRLTIPSLRSSPCPCVLYFHAGHYAVLTGVRGDSFFLADPSLGQRVLTVSQLSALWNGQALLVGPAAP